MGWPADIERPVVVAGEALVDLVEHDDGSLTAHPGGGPFNAARTIGRLGQPVAFLGRLSDDSFGTALRGSLARDGVVVPDGLRTARPTTLALAELDGDGSATYRFYLEGTSAAALRPSHARAALVDAVHSLHLGALGLVLEPFASTVIEQAAILRPSTLISLDPNCRPHAVEDWAGYRRVVDRAIAVADLVKLSEEDALCLDRGVEPDDLARTLLERGPHLVVLTRGARGATAFTASWEIDVAAHPVEVVDTIGAGDAFSGALLAHFRRWDHGREHLDDRDVVRSAMDFATTVSGVVCGRRGADPPLLNELHGDPLRMNGGRPAS